MHDHEQLGADVLRCAKGNLPLPRIVNPQIRFMPLSLRARIHLLAASMLALDVSAQHVFQCAAAGAPGTQQQSLMPARERDSTRYLKVHAVIATAPGDNGAQQVPATFDRVNLDLEFANQVLEQSATGIQLTMCDPIDVVEDPSMFYASGSDPTSFFAHRRSGYISVFYVGYMGAVAGGAATDMIMVAQSAGRHVLVHELGHLLGLQHTVTLIGEPELVDGSNCSTAADGLCDTPAEPYPIPAGMIDPLTCAYTGDLVDINGDAYAPMLDNIMAVGWCQPDTFTPQQGERMRYVVDELKPHILVSATPVTIDPLPDLICANAAPMQLSATPGPGVFSGPLVQGDQLVNSPNPAGEYYVTYVPDAPPEGLMEVVDQYHVPELWYTGFQFPLPTDSVRQTFRAGRDGSFTGIEARLHSAAPTEYRMRLYQGSGAALTLLHDTVASMAGTDTVWVRFDVPAGVACAANGIYSFVITADLPFNAIAPIGGYLGYGNNNLGPLNLMFRTWVRTNMPCQQATHNYTLYAVPERSVVNLADAYCHDDSGTIELLADQHGTTSSTLLIDGEMISAFIPAALAVGQHEVQHIYAMNGCTDTLSQAFTIAGPMAFGYPGIPSTVCADGGPIVLASEPPSGSFLIDGVPAIELDPAALSLGDHMLTHINTAQLDTVVFTDQECCLTGITLNSFLHDGEESWQPFAPSQAGTLESIRISLELFNVPRQLVVELRNGVGVDGALLHTDTITASTHDGVLLAGTGLPVSPGDTLTWAIRKVPDGNPSLPPMIRFTLGEHYPFLASAPTWADTIGSLRFEERIEQRFSCTDSTSIPVSVEVCAGLTELAGSAWSAGPNPFVSSIAIKGADGGGYALYTTTGQCVERGRLQGGTMVLDAGHHPAGGYSLMLYGADGAPKGCARLLKVE